MSTYNRGVSSKEKFDPSYRDFESSIKKHKIGPKKWTDGIYQDLLRIDPDLNVVNSKGKPYTGETTIVNTVIAFGTFFFATDICIRTNKYVEHVFYHYYNDRSMESIWLKINHFRKHGIQYWNPFNDNVAMDQNDMRRQKNKREKDIEMGEICENREMFGNTKIMDDSDCFADNRTHGMLYEGFFASSYHRKH